MALKPCRRRRTVARDSGREIPFARTTYANPNAKVKRFATAWMAKNLHTSAGPVTRSTLAAAKRRLPKSRPTAIAIFSIPYKHQEKVAPCRIPAETENQNRRSEE